MTKPYIIGIDPGKKGAITALYGGKLVSTLSMPATPRELYETFLYLGLPKNYRGELVIALEDVHSMPTDGSRQAFTFGRGLGHIEGVLASLELDKYIQRISPMKWMSHFEMKRDKEETKYQFKKRLRELACKLSKKELSLDDADSYLIARYQYEYLSGTKG